MRRIVVESGAERQSNAAATRSEYSHNEVQQTLASIHGGANERRQPKDRVNNRTRAAGVVGVQYEYNH